MAVKTAPNTRAKPAAAPTAETKPTVRIRRMPLDPRAASAGIMFDASTLCWHRDPASGTLTQITFGSLPKFLDRLETGLAKPTAVNPTGNAPAKRGRPPGSGAKSKASR